MNSHIVILSVIALVISIIPHEVAHGYMAYRLGDPTARQKGRLTLNPIVHIDPIGSLLLPFLLIIIPGNSIVFGWAKPVPINPAYFRDPKQGMMLVGAAGPLTNFAFAAIAAVLFKLGGLTAESTGGLFLVMMCLINVVLGILNLLPVPPLDGSRIVAGLLPDRMMRSYYRIQPFGFMIVLVFLFAGGLQHIVTPIIRIIMAFLGVRLS